MYYHLILTDNCNLCCTYCRGKAFSVEPPDLPDIVIDEDLPVDLAIDLDDLYRFLAKDPDAVLTFYGGEPLLAAGFIREITRDAPVSALILHTNGTLLDRLEPAIVNRFDTILVSIDGPEPLTDAHRGAGTYGRIIRNLQGLTAGGFAGELIARMTVTEDTDIVEAVRLSSCGANRQAVRLVVVNKPEAVAKVQPLVKWAAYLPPEQGTPKADELPTLYVAVVQDTSIPGDLATDTGIALANMTLAAWDKGVGSCIMGAINKPALTELLGIEEPQKLAFMVAFGYPAHKAHIVPLTAETGVKYYLDENRDYCVPKRSKEEIAKYL